MPDDTTSTSDPAPTDAHNDETAAFEGWSFWRWPLLRAVGVACPAASSTPSTSGGVRHEYDIERVLEGLRGVEAPLARRGGSR